LESQPRFIFASPTFGTEIASVSLSAIEFCSTGSLCVVVFTGPGAGWVLHAMDTNKGVLNVRRLCHNTSVRWLAGLTLVGTLVICLGTKTASAEDLFLLSTRNQLIHINSASPGSLLSSIFITGLSGSEEVISIDARPLTGVVYGLTSYSRLVMLDQITGAATAVGSGWSPVLNGVEFGFDFNPTTDVARVESDLRQNLRVNSVTGSLIGVDAPLYYAAGDPNQGIVPNVVGSAYSNNLSGAQTTTLYVIDSGTNTLATQNPPNNGTLNTVGLLGFNTNGLVGFDISGASGVAYAAMTAPGASFSSLYTINLASGVATLVGTIGNGENPLLIRGLTVVPEPGSMLALGTGLTGLLALVLRRRAS